MALTFITICSSAFWIYGKCGRGAQDQAEENQTVLGTVLASDEK